jgi:hypothetical protein
MAYIPIYSTTLADGANLDAFSRLRVSQNNILLAAEMVENDLPLIFDTSASLAPATASYNKQRASVMMEAGTASGSIVIRQTKEYYLYRAGQSHFVILTMAKAHAETDIRKRLGYFDAEDGIFLETQNSATNIVLRKTIDGVTSETSVAQASWNIDPLDGTGPSGLTLNLEKANILIIDFQWLGAGRVRVGFDINGLVYYVHAFNNANQNDSVYMRTATLPVRYEIENLDTVGTTGQ